MRKLPGLFTVVIAVAVLAGVNAASASPPTGQIGVMEHGRAQQAANATVTIPAADNVSSSYTIAPGGDTGWRTGPGDAVVAVFKGTLTADQAQGCATQEVAAGHSVVVPTGKFRLRNAGSEPVEFAGIFFNLSVGGPNPLVEGQAESAPACGGVSPAAVAPQGVSATDSARGAIPADGAYAVTHGGNTPGTVVHSLEAGKDMFVVTYTFEPGSSTGWIVHTDEMAIITKGTVAIWEARDGACKKVEEYSAGQAWAHKPHRHMGVNERSEPAVVRIIGFNMKHGEPLPVLGSTLDHVDFTQSPPADCPRLR